MEINLGEGLEEIGNRCFDWSFLEEIRFPASFRKFNGDSQFFLCKHLKKMHLSDAVDTIPDQFCYWAESLEELNLPKNLVHVGTEAFWGCQNIPLLHFSENLKSIMNYAFYDCYGVKSIMLPKDFEYLGSLCFYGVVRLKELYCAAPIPPKCEVTEDHCPFGFYSSEYPGTPRDIPVYVPVGSAEIYRQAPGWDYFTNFVEIEEFPEASVHESSVDKRYDVETIYDLSGKRVSTLEPGNVYVRNGKKIVIKSL